MKTLNYAAAIGLFVSPAFAQAPAPAPPPPPPPVWSGAAQASFLNTSGNSETSILGLGADAKYQPTGPWSYLIRAGINRGSVAGKENLRNLGGAVRGARALDPKTDLYFEAGYAEDLYAGIDSRYTGELGLSRKVASTGPHFLTVEAGIGGARETRLLPRSLKSTQSFGTARAGFLYKYAFSKTAEFSNQFGFLENLKTSDDWRMANTAAITAALNSRFSIKVSHALGHLNTPPPGKKKTDTAVAAALVAKF